MRPHLQRRGADSALLHHPHQVLLLEAQPQAGQRHVAPQPGSHRRHAGRHRRRLWAHCMVRDLQGADRYGGCIWNIDKKRAQGRVCCQTVRRTTRVT